MSQSLLNISYLETLDKVDSYEEYLSSLIDTLDTQEWERAVRIDIYFYYTGYLRCYPNGIYKNEAQKRIDSFIKEVDKRAWEKAKRENSKKSYEKYLMSYYNGIYSNEAKLKVDEFIRLEKEEHRLAVAKEKEAWELVCKKNTKEDYENYLKFYPNGIYYNEAERKATLLYKELTPKTNYSGQRLFTFQKNGKYGVVDITDKIILKAQYNQIEFIGNRYILVHSDGYKQGLYSTSGKEIIALGDYDLRVDGGGYKTEIIKQHNPNDDFIVSAIGYDKQWIYNSSFMKMFDSSLTKIIDIKNYTFGYINNDNKLLLRPIYTNIYLYKNRIGRIVKKGGKHRLCGLINNKFEIITDVNYGHIDWKSNNSNYAVIKNKDWTKEGIVNIEGKIVIPYTFDWIEALENSYFIAHKGSRWEKNGLIDPQGKIIIDVNYSHIHYIKEEKIFLIEDNDKFGFTNTKGEITIEPELDEIYSGYMFNSYGHKPSNTKHKYLFFHTIEEPIKVKKDNKYGFIDKKGNYLLYPKYNYISYQEYISKNVYLYLIAEDSNGYKKGFLIYNNGKTTTVFSKTIDITYINLLNKNLIEFSDTAFGRGISTIDGKILLESTNPISYKFKKNKIIEEYKK